MRTSLSVFTALLVIVGLAALKSETVKSGIASLFSNASTEDRPPAPRPVCKPGQLVLSANACTPAPTRSGRFVVNTVIEVTRQNVNLPLARQAVANSRVIDRIAEDLNGTFDLPRDIPVLLTACGEPNAFYDSAAQNIKICDELVDGFGEAFADLSNQPPVFARAILSAIAFAFAHEAGHAVIHQFQLGITGREEDVADQFAVYLLAGTPTGAREVLSGAEAFGRLAKDGGRDLMWDSHSLNAQRYFNIICWTYGSNPAAFPVVLTNGGLPLDRAVTCQNEYRQMAAGFDRLLQSHRRSRGLLTGSVSPAH